MMIDQQYNGINMIKGEKLEGYRLLLRRFLSGEITGHEFERLYLDKFKSEDTIWSSEIYEILNELFHDVDAFCDDPAIRNADDLSESQLRQRAKIADEELEVLSMRGQSYIE
jgi:hypothetical protein